MPNYIRQQSPWVSAAESMNGGLNVLAGMYSQLPQIRAQQQHQADQLALQQGALDLNQQEHLAKVPVYNAQAANYQAGADKDKAGAAQLNMLMEFAKQAQQAKYLERGGSQLQNGQGPTIENAQNMATAQLLAALAGASTLAPDSAQRALEAEQAPVKLNAGQTAFDPRSFTPLAQGLVSAPFGNTVQAGMQLPGNPVIQQQGQFRPSAAGQIDPTTRAKNVMEYLTGKGELGTKTIENPAVQKILEQVEAALFNQGGGTLSSNPPTQRPVIKSIKQIR
jgi:hypothetical protein